MAAVSTYKSVRKKILFEFQNPEIKKKNKIINARVKCLFCAALTTVGGTIDAELCVCVCVCVCVCYDDATCPCPPL